jgi:hypothetical protein
MRTGDGDPESGAGTATFKTQLARARLAVVEEHSVVQATFSRLVSWARGGEARAGFLFLAIEGFDLDPAEYYLWSLQEAAAGNVAELQQAARQLGPFDLRPVVEGAAAAIAERGWSVFTFFSGQAADGLGFKGSDNASREVFRSFVGDRSGPVAGAAEQGVGSLKATPDLAFMQPRQSLATVAEVTGGEVIETGAEAAGALGDLDRSLLLAYQVARPADGRAHEIQVRTTRPGVTITAPKKVFSGTPEGESEMRARRVLAGGERPRELPVQVSITSRPSIEKGRGAGVLTVRARLGDLRDVLETLGLARLRVTVVVDVDGAEPFVSHQLKETGVGSGEDWVFEAPILWPPEARRTVVLVEELATGLYGAGVAAFPRLRGDPRQRFETDGGGADATVH